MKALSIRQPWAWLIAHGYKDLENRTWRTGFRGRVLIHAGKTMTRREYDECFLFCNGPVECRIADFPAFDQLKKECGGIVGEATITDCVSRSASPWFFGDYGFVMKDAKVLPFRACRGVLSFFEVNYGGKTE